MSVSEDCRPTGRCVWCDVFQWWSVGSLRCCCCCCCCRWVGVLHRRRRRRHVRVPSHQLQSAASMIVITCFITNVQGGKKTGLFLSVDELATASRMHCSQIQYINFSGRKDSCKLCKIIQTQYANSTLFYLEKIPKLSTFLSLTVDNLSMLKNSPKNSPVFLARPVDRTLQCMLTI